MVCDAAEMILVTGGAGFIGSALVKALVGAGEKVRVLDNGFRSKPGTNFIFGDIRDFDDVSEAAEGVDAIYHLAFINGTRHFYETPDLVLDVAVRGIINVVSACHVHNVATLMLVSSSEVYQTPPVVPTDETAPMTIPDLFNPRYSYAAGKIISEMMAVHCKPASRVVIVRPHNIYGPNMGDEHVIPNVVHKILKGEAIKLWGLAQTRAFCHIDDAVRGLMIARDAPGGVYNLGTTEEVTIRDLADRIAALLGREAKIVESEVMDGGALRRCPDISRLAALGYRPRVRLDEGLKETVGWYAKLSELRQ
jgi:nucleoside-diphosphate-sugar epimerase